MQTVFSCNVSSTLDSGGTIVLEAHRVPVDCEDFDHVLALLAWFREPEQMDAPFPVEDEDDAEAEAEENVLVAIAEGEDPSLFACDDCEAGPWATQRQLSQHRAMAHKQRECRFCHEMFAVGLLNGHQRHCPSRVEGRETAPKVEVPKVDRFGPPTPIGHQDFDPDVARARAAVGL